MVVLSHGQKNSYFELSTIEFQLVASLSQYKIHNIEVGVIWLGLISHHSMVKMYFSLSRLLSNSWAIISSSWTFYHVFSFYVSRHHYNLTFSCYNGHNCFAAALHISYASSFVSNATVPFHIDDTCTVHPWPALQLLFLITSVPMFLSSMFIQYDFQFIPSPQV